MWNNVEQCGTNCSQLRSWLGIHPFHSPSSPEVHRCWMEISHSWCSCTQAPWKTSFATWSKCWLWPCVSMQPACRHCYQCVHPSALSYHAPGNRHNLWTSSSRSQKQVCSWVNSTRENRADQMEWCPRFPAGLWSLLGWLGLRFAMAIRCFECWIAHRLYNQRWDILW